MDIVGYISKLQSSVFQIRNDDDFADRLNYRYTVAILVAFAVIVSNRQFSESVIRWFWVPAHFTQNFEAYANQVCWIQNTYHVNTTHHLPKDEESRKTGEIKYYQWIPFILLLQAFLFYIPRILWRMLSSRAGLEVRDLIEAAQSYKSVEKFENKDRLMKYIVINIDQYVSNPRRVRKKDKIRQRLLYFLESFCFGSGIYLGNYITTTYFFTKFLYLINSMCQILLMNEFLGRNFLKFGYELFLYVFTGVSGYSMTESVYFPRVVMCDFYIREFGHPNQSHRYSVQCVLPINLYNQQIFTFLWFWFFILIVANVWAIIIWAIRLFTYKKKLYIEKKLRLMTKYKELKNSYLNNKRADRDDTNYKRTKKNIDEFIDLYLRSDGSFMIRLISSLTSEVVGTEILHALWKMRVNKEHKLDSNIDDNISKLESNELFVENSNKIILSNIKEEIEGSNKSIQIVSEQNQKNNSALDSNNDSTPLMTHKSDGANSDKSGTNQKLVSAAPAAKTSPRRVSFYTPNDHFISSPNLTTFAAPTDYQLNKYKH